MILSKNTGMLISPLKEYDKNPQSTTKTPLPSPPSPATLDPRPPGSYQDLGNSWSHVAPSTSLVNKSMWWSAGMAGLQLEFAR